ncbi:MAG: hypothetical protein U0X74_08670 [Anaerolineales bacterium]
MRNDNTNTQIIAAIIAALAVIVSAIISLQAAREPVLLEIKATQTAEANLTASAATANVPNSISGAATPAIITIVVTATPDLQQIPQSTTPSQPQETWIDYIPGVRFTPNSYFIFSIILSVLVLIAIIMPNFERPFGVFWLIYFDMMVFYNIYLILTNQVSFYVMALSVLLTVGFGSLVWSRRHIFDKRDSNLTLSKFIFTVIQLPLAFAIIIAGWQQVDLLLYISKVFPWNMTIYALLLVIVYI